jgi:hypothetical protein
MLEYFAIRHGLKLEHVLWEMDAARIMQLLYCESVKNGHQLRYAMAVEDSKTNKQFEQLERNLIEWQSEHQ